jgi:dipeptidyl aminopeptidase/acylaminoacyl peptidase
MILMVARAVWTCEKSGASAPRCYDGSVSDAATAIVLGAMAFMLGGAQARGEPAGRPSGLIVGSFATSLPMSDPGFQFHGGCAVRGRDLQTRRKLIFRKPRNIDDCLHAPIMSPDGTRLLFGADVDRKGVELRLVGRDGSGERSVATYASDAQIAYAWSPDGALIAIAKRDVRGSQDPHWIVIDPDGKRAWPVKPCVPQIGEEVFQWAPDGDGLLMVDQPREGGSFRALNPLVRCDFAGARHDLGPQITFGTKVVLSPDARSLLIVAYQSNAILTVATVESRPIWNGADLERPFWSPDGDWIGALVPPRPNYVRELQLFDVKSGKVKRTGMYDRVYELSWWSPRSQGTVDSRAVLRGVLGLGQEVLLPLRIDP